ncbi:MAG: DUF86 domain-containing protein [Proteobacteria bacterium]|nr:DUF86 domain-containing protein [Pseudomonadota bacterium]
MNDEIKKNLVDILQAAEEIRTFVQGMDFKAYRDSSVTQRAVERDFEIIGEALARIRKIDEGFLENISDYQRIIGFRNILIHGYDIIDDIIVWKAAENHLPILVKEIQEMLLV